MEALIGLLAGVVVLVVVLWSVGVALLVVAGWCALIAALLMLALVPTEDGAMSSAVGVGGFGVACLLAGTGLRRGRDAVRRRRSLRRAVPPAPAAHRGVRSGQAP